MLGTYYQTSIITLDNFTTHNIDRQDEIKSHWKCTLSLNNYRPNMLSNINRLNQDGRNHCFSVITRGCPNVLSDVLFYLLWDLNNKMMQPKANKTKKINDPSAELPICAEIVSFGKSDYVSATT
jgi:hypothetical protein